MRKIKWTVVVLAIIAVSAIVLCACEGFWGKETSSPEEPSQTLPETPQEPNTGDESGEGAAKAAARKFRTNKAIRAKADRRRRYITR